MTNSHISTNIEQFNKELKYICDSLVTFELKLGLNSNVSKNTIQEAEQLQNIDWAAFKEEDPLTIGIYSCILSDYAFILQRAANYEKSIIQWCDRRTQSLNKEYPDFQKKINAQKTASLLKLSRIENLHFSIKNLSDKLEFLANLKIRVLKENNSGTTQEKTNDL